MGTHTTAGLEDRFHPGSFLDQIGDDDFEEMLSLGRVQFFPRGVTLQTEGEVPGRLLLMLSGMVKVCHYAADGRELILSLVGAGELIGEPLGPVPARSPGTVVTLVEMQILMISNEVMADYLHDHQQVRDMFINTLVAQLKAAQAERIEMVMNDATGRLARKLIDLAMRFGVDDGPDGRVRIRLPLTQQELAAWTGSSREAVSRALQRMRLRGWIEVGRGEITILDMARLRQRVYFSETPEGNGSCGHGLTMRSAL